ncbi:hydroxyacylglutathione hydrolase [Leptospira sp. GIMC2001]|uniref:hydroxyacylglutathione hydrolase n=1 Tax=Leptospira sp. GIMC2001 TaxID=1513297 RepID=UPI0023495F21|nr:hydroxyacylglutathione hydrolase [Leptospira sp. GIMC2001]WCL51150.1 hydroxyacylglutathione hydrolase [Leptospira sp. GIMC2001]
MDVVQLYTNSSLRNFTYLIIDAKSKLAICIDPHFPEQILGYLESNNLSLHAIINTHEHNDHICGNKGLFEYTKEGIWTHPFARSKIPNSIRSLNANEVIFFGHGYLKILDTPGHTFSHITILGIVNDKILFTLTGDSLFNASVGNCSRGGDPETLYNTVRNYYNPLPDDVILYPGHDYFENNLRFTLSIDPANQLALDILDEVVNLKKQNRFLLSNLGLEKQLNLFFQLSNKRMRSSLNDSELILSEKEIFLQLRKLRDNW